MFWVYRYKGFSFTAARTVHTALVLAGQQGCSQADTGHLLLALVQTAQGTAADFLRRKRVTAASLADCRAERPVGSPRRLHRQDIAPELCKAMEFAVLGAHAASAGRGQAAPMPFGGVRMSPACCRTPCESARTQAAAVSPMIAPWKPP